MSVFRRRDGAGNDEGFALITVLLATMALMALGTAAVAYGLGSQNASRRDQDWNAALAAAEAGIDDYVFRLNENSNYYMYSASNLPPDGNAAFNGWQAVQGPANQSSFHYSVNATQLTTQGTLEITSSGRSGARKVTRTILSTLRRRSFIDYLYFTDYETIDPATYPNSSSTATATWAQANCSKHWYEARPEGGGNQCVPINFISADNLNGPVHSNDAMLICGTPRFNGKTTTSWNTAPRWRGNSGCSGNNPIVANPGDPAYATPLTMPPSNAALKAEVVPLKGGCLYTGPTRITLTSSGMTVDSPFSKQTNNACPTNGTGSLPTNGVIYVQSVPSSPSDPNYTSGCPYNASNSTGVRYGNRSDQPRRAHPLGYPVASDTTTYGCRDGDVFLSGSLNGQLTIAAENNINAVANVTYNGGLSGTDLLGLIANNYVQIYHPISCATANNAGCNITSPSTPVGGASLSNARIDGAILSLAHSFRVQNWSAGAGLGTLTINGAIAQRYRGAVGTGAPSVQSGYAKAYTYDNRLKYLSPPKFLDPVAAAWGANTWAEIVNPTGLPS